MRATKEAPPAVPRPAAKPPSESEEDAATLGYGLAVVFFGGLAAFALSNDAPGPLVLVYGVIAFVYGLATVFRLAEQA
jgi:hypothetical protein